jgi:hypothetical protein
MIITDLAAVISGEQKGIPLLLEGMPFFTQKQKIKSQ